MRFQYHPEAAYELKCSIEYYEGKTEGLGAEFLDEIENTIARALAHPDSGFLVTNHDRRLLLNRFPYEVIYEVSGSTITINAESHATN